jgi:recombination protein RecT
MAANNKKEAAEQVESDIRKYLPAIEDLLGKKSEIPVEKYFQLVVRQAKEKLLECTRQSIIVSILDCASLRLSPDPILGHAYFIPYNNTKLGRKECQFMPGYKGYINLAMRNGLESIRAEVIRKNDKFEYEEGTNPYIKHIKPLTGDRGEFIGAYAIAELSKSPKPLFKVMTQEEVLAIKKMSKSSSSEDSPWNKWETEQWQKTVLKKLCKTLDLSPEVNIASEIEDSNEFGYKIVRPYIDIEKLPDSTQPPEEDKNIQILRKALEVIPVGVPDTNLEEILKEIGRRTEEWSKVKHSPEVRELGLFVLKSFEKEVRDAYSKV